jgi:hypothetical protein
MEASFDVSPSSTTSEINLSGIKSPLRLVVTVDSSDNFPRNFLFMEKAVRQWLTDEYNKIKNAKV